MQIAICDPQFQREVRHLHHLGPRALGELLIALATSAIARERLSLLLNEYSTRSPALLAEVGGETFPPCYIYVFDADGEPRPVRRPRS